MPYWFKRMVSFFSWHVQKGWDTARMIARGLQVFANRSRSDVERAIDLARESVDNAMRASGLQPDQPISDAFPSGTRYDDEVTVSAVVRVNTTSRGQSYITVKATVPTNFTMSEILDVLLGITRNKMRRYNVIGIEVSRIQGPLMFRLN